MLQTVLTILGGIFLLILLVLAYFALRIALVVHAAKKAFGELAGLAPGAWMNPATITLEPLVDDDESTDGARDALATLEADGWRRFGSFLVPEVGVRLRSLRRGSSFAVTHEMMGVGTWVDVVAETSDGRMLLSTNAPIGQEIDAPNWVEREWARDGSVDDVVSRFERLASGHELVELDDSEFASWFEDGYRRVQEWRMKRGGPTREEIERIAASMEGRFDAKTIELVREQLGEQTRLQLFQACLDRYIESSGLSASEWRRLEERAFVVHENMERDEVVDTIASWLDVDGQLFDDDGEPSVDWSEGDEPRAWFARFNEGLPAAQRAERRGEVEDPVAADVWIAPGFQLTFDD